MAPVLTSTFLMLLASSSALVTATPFQKRGNYSGKMTWIGDTTGALTSCGAPYEAGSMYVAVNAALNTCPVSGGSGTPMTITCNGKTVQATAIDKCMGCDPDHIDVATAVYEACGFTTTDGGMQMGISWSF